ncbi:TIGR03960 family B12-binding radical SAM protein [Candidatus Electronema sp. PJ]|uniref:TIGR03960 family B12-binding radical SAM protein n=1 Tax=Candidatus Electronema sp. PJ TaxID=3401572 RepID=UPI003AA7C0BD
MHTKLSLDSILPLVRKPGRYIGGELHAARPDYAAVELAFALIFPDLYEIGTSHQGLQILYHILNREPGLAAERCFCPDTDMEEQLRRHKLPLFSLESRRPLAAFDVIGITLPYELCFSNILTILDLAQIPLRAAERGEDAPLVIGGGSCSMNPEPLADFFDAVVLGDGEEVILEIAAALRAAKRDGLSRQEKLHRLAEIAGVYVPSFFEPQYEGQQLKAVIPLKPGYTHIRRRIVPQLPPTELLERPLVPMVKPVHDRLGVEIARGCTRGCRFCQAGMIYRPVRERTVEQVMQLAEQGIQNSGFGELALLSLSTGDYSCLPELLTKLMDRFAEERVSISLPSMRVGTLTPEVIAQIRRVRKTGFTVAPEAGTDRLREVINKGITEADLLAGCRDAFNAGWSVLKFYFMIGLPTETLEDVDAIVDLAARARREASGKKADINVSVSTFVPKPHTPFQWCSQISLDESKERIQRLMKKLPPKGYKLKWHDPEQCLLEGVFSRGDRRLSRLLEEAWRDGARLDGWNEHFSLARWQQAAERVGIDLEFYLRQRDRSEVLPWDHLSSGVDRSFLEREYERAMERAYTPDCRNQGCQNCGLCDFKSIRPLVNPPKEAAASTGPAVPKQERDKNSQPTIFRYRADYSRLGDGRFIGHLELLNLVFRALQRAGLPVLFSQGFNPTPRVTFSPALPVGVESEMEFFEVDLAEPVRRPAEVMAELNRQLPSFMAITALALAKKKAPVNEIISYDCLLPEGVDAEQARDSIAAFQITERFLLERRRKGKSREFDLKEFVRKLELGEGGRLLLDLYHPCAEAGVGPRDTLAAVFGLQDEQAELVRIVKMGVREA